MEMHPPLNILWFQFLVPRPATQFRQFGSEFHDAFALAVMNHRHHQALRRINGNPDVEIFLDDQVFTAIVE